jgi:hypothetical protein
MKKIIVKFFPIVMSLLTSFSVSAETERIKQSEVGWRCNYPFNCGSESVATDNRSNLDVIQLTSPTDVMGNCMKLPSSQNYMARINGLECGTSSIIQHRTATEHPYDKLDENFSAWNSGDQYRAQKAMLVNEGWIVKLPIQLREHWTYKRKVGGYVRDCAQRFNSEGGEPETYQTTCYRTGRTEKVFRNVITKERKCLVYNSPPPPPPEDDSDEDYTSVGAGVSSPNRKSSPSPSRQQNSTPRSTTKTLPAQKKNSGGSTGDMKNNKKGQGRWGHFNFASPNEIRSLAVSARGTDNLRKISDDKIIRRDGDDGSYGCSSWSSDYSTVKTEVEIYDVPAPDLEYPCEKTRYRWCTWFVDENVSAFCPEKKMVNLDIKYITPNDWNPDNKGVYDPQLPNKFDLLLGEEEFVKIQTNSTVSSEVIPKLDFKNALNGRDLPWNNYEVISSPQSQTCEYKDMNFNIEIKTLGRNIQPAPNPLALPKDENGNIIALEGSDTDGRPANLHLINNARDMVLDRSNMSRIFGEDPVGPMSDSSGLQVKTEQKPKGGLSKKFWENTRFRVRLIWRDSNNTRIKVTQANEFTINQAQPSGNNLTVSLEGKMGMTPFYKLSIPFEDLIGFLGTNVSLDPNKKYFLEVKIAQTGFDGIYKSGLSLDDQDDEGAVPMEQQQIRDRTAYSEPMEIPFAALESKPNFLDKIWHSLSSRMYRPARPGSKK